MEVNPEMQPLPLKHRRYTFFLLLALFVIAIPFLYLYATGYRINFGATTTFISTGGLYIAVERTGAEIYIDDELVRETRTFRRAFYAQGIDPGTHRVHVQKPDHHTWVKELPVYPYVVTEAQAFNLPLVPEVRIVSPWRTATGETILFASSTLEVIPRNPTIIGKRSLIASYITDAEYDTLIELFTATSTATSQNARTSEVNPFFSTTTGRGVEDVVATTTKISNGVQLFELAGEVYAEWVGSREQMPYYYCAEEFPLTGTQGALPGPTKPLEVSMSELIGPVQYVAEDAVCTPSIRLDRKGQEIRSFDFYPASTDFVILALHDGVYVVEVDDRAWQNMQPIVLGEDLDMRVFNGNIYIYDGTLIYQVVIEN